MVNNGLKSMVPMPHEHSFWNMDCQKAEIVWDAIALHTSLDFALLPELPHNRHSERES